MKRMARTITSKGIHKQGRKWQGRSHTQQSATDLLFRNVIYKITNLVKYVVFRTFIYRQLRRKVNDEKTIRRNIIVQ